MGRLALTALASVLAMTAASASWAEPAATSELSIVPAGTTSTEALVGKIEPSATPPEPVAENAEPVAPETDAQKQEPAPAEQIASEPEREERATTETSDPASVDLGVSPQETAAIPSRDRAAGERAEIPDAAPEETSQAHQASPDDTVEADSSTQEPEAAPKAEVVIRDPETQAAEAIRAALAALPEPTEDYERAERTALTEFYGARAYAPLWTDATGFNGDAKAAMAVFETATQWGLDPEAFPLPKLAEDAETLAPEAQAALEADLMQLVLTYARHARGGRIMSPSEQLNSNLDRKAQLIPPDELLATLASAPDKGQALLDTHPAHPQFHLLREKYVAALGKSRDAKPNAAAKRLRANMEMWRWKWPDIGEFHLIANVPSYTIRVVHGGKTVHTERIVVGELGKQTSIFSRRLRDVTFRPMWRVPESIKVRELWPSLLRGGGMMRQYGLEVETKSGRRLDWRTMDWANTDIRNYEVVQPPGAKSAMGYVKFSFPSQHTIFMHDTPDKWMFNQRQRTLSAGCLRLRNPLRVAELVLAYEKGWDADQIDELARRGALNNEVLIDKRIPMHIVYQTAWVDEDGKLQLYSDIYGHEKRVTLALDGKWDQINKGRNHLAPHVPDRNEVARAQRTGPPRATARSNSSNSTFMSSFGGGF